MIVVREPPPMFERIAAAFPGARAAGVLFAFAPNVYIPNGGEFTPELRAHERVHVEQQERLGVYTWWEHYIDNPEFRLKQELEAHRAEWRAFKRTVDDRNMRSRILRNIASKLASPLYGSLISETEARKEITA